MVLELFINRTVNTESTKLYQVKHMNTPSGENLLITNLETKKQAALFKNRFSFSVNLMELFRHQLAEIGIRVTFKTIVESQEYIVCFSI